MKKELETTYDPGAIEERLYQKWLDNKYFHAEVDETKQPYTIVIPPPNITGKLHMGHALDETLQDILIRFKKMQGYNALWIPGTDHASIAIEGRREGEIKGEIKNKILLIQKKSQRGDSMEKIIDDLMESIEFVQPIYEMIKQNPELSVDEIYRIISK